MAIELNEVQRAFVNEAARPMIEKLIRFRYELDAFVLDADNQQAAISTAADVLNDNLDGSAPRADAPQLQGAHLLQLRNFAAAMRDQINGTALNALVALSVRSVNTIMRGRE
jgi:hypothetical protein